MAVMAAIASGGPVPEVAYRLTDMAADAIGLLDHLGVDRAHIVGASMGGMIVQTMAIEHPDRVASMVSVMSMPGDPSVGQPTAEAMAVLLRTPPADREAYIEGSADAAVFASKKYVDLERMRQFAADGVRPRVLPGGCGAPAGRDLGERRSFRATARGARPDARHPRSRRHAHHAQRRRAHGRARSPAPTCSCSPTWATTCPNRCGRRS